MNFIQRLLYGRYGWDQLNFCLTGTALVLYLLDLALDLSVLYVLYLLCVVAALYRMLSRNYARRRAENAKFLTVAGPAIRWFKLQRTIHRDKEHRYFKCPNCGQQLRVPRGKGKVTITCRNCGASFQEKS